MERYSGCWFSDSIKVLKVIYSILKLVDSKMHEMKYLPDPTDASNFDFWERCQRECTLQRRSSGSLLSGNPHLWKERCVKRGGVFYRDVPVYANIMTWSKSKGITCGFARICHCAAWSLPRHPFLWCHQTQTQHDSALLKPSKSMCRQGRWLVDQYHHSSGQRLHQKNLFFSCLTCNSFDPRLKNCSNP